MGRYLKQTNQLDSKDDCRIGSRGGSAFRVPRARPTWKGLAAVNLDFFRFEGNERDISTQVMFWPSFSDFGRIRIDITSGIRYEIFKDLSWGFNFWNNYDSRPPTEDAKNDFGLSTTIGYKF